MFPGSVLVARPACIMRLAEYARYSMPSAGSLRTAAMLRKCIFSSAPFEPQRAHPPAMGRIHVEIPGVVLAHRRLVDAVRRHFRQSRLESVHECLPVVRRNHDAELRVPFVDVGDP